MISLSETVLCPVMTWQRALNNRETAEMGKLPLAQDRIWKGALQGNRRQTEAGEEKLCREIRQWRVEKIRVIR